MRFIAVELITGETLKDRIHRERTALRTLVGALAQAGERIAKAHAAGIVHRDLKPGNIRITRDGFGPAQRSPTVSLLSIEIPCRCP